MHVIPLWGEQGSSAAFSEKRIDNALVKRMKKAWKNKNGTPCGIYDVGNLQDVENGGDIIAVIANDKGNYLENAGKFYGAKKMSPDAFVKLLATQSKKGQTPLKNVTIVGHGYGSTKILGGDNSDCVGCKQFLTLDGESQFKFPSFENAAKFNLSKGCWFRTDSKVRLVGCNTNKMADSIANHYLRRGANAYGTEKFTYAPNDKEMGWGHWKSHDGLTVIDGKRSKSPEEYHKHKFWAEYGGKN